MAHHDPVARRLFLQQSSAALALLGLGADLAHAAPPPPPPATTAPPPKPRPGLTRTPLAQPGPMLPPVPAILLSVAGKPDGPDELSVLWTFVVSGSPPQVGVSAEDDHVARELIARHRAFVLNVPDASMIHPFDRVDMNSSRVADKYALSGLTRGRALTIDAPTVEEAPIQLECRLLHTLRVPPVRTVFIAEVVATTVHEGICDADGRLRVAAAPFFGMTAGSGEFYTLGQRVGHIGQTLGRRDIRY